ncbi:hypothetical protein AC1031_009772 [Aphanomyces cochlioides]|nr:hypothetical protein AC1031_009772 [Aphanomyces cochlioides]
MKLTLKAKHNGGKVEIPAKKAPEAPVEKEEEDSGDENEGADDDDEGDDEDEDDDDDDEPQDDNYDDDDDGEEEAQDDEEEAEGAVGFADAMSKVLNQNVEEEKAPILAKRVTAQMREISKDKKATTATKLSAKEKRARDEKDMVIPSHLTMAKDKTLRAIATKGVVALFNAIAKHQHGQQAQDGSKQIKSLSKDSFLGLLKNQGKKKEEAEEPKDKSTWSIVQDDFMMDAKLKDWDKNQDSDGEDDVWNVEDKLDDDEPQAKKASTKKQRTK